MKQPWHIVIVGGGAGGIELATRLGMTVGKQQSANITLIDPNLVHIWKPLWHEVAAGTLLPGATEINYIIHAYKHYFRFQWGSLTGLNKDKKEIYISAVNDKLHRQILPERVISYDSLIICIGSTSNDFNTEGVKKHCFFLDNHHECQSFHQQFLKYLFQLQEKILPKLEIAIIGGGATGIELAAELKFACRQALHYRNKNIFHLPQISISIIESAPRILSTLPEEFSQLMHQELDRQGIRIFTNEFVTKVDENTIYTKNNSEFPATVKLWAAGIKAPELLTTLGLKANSRNQLLVMTTLQSVDDENIFAFGDCASCPQPDSAESVPPRAQAAHQQARLLAESLNRLLQGKSLLPYYYHDYGSLITLSQSRTLGIMLQKRIGNITLKGTLARLAYRFLYRQHQAALYGWWRVGLLIIAEFLTQPLRPRLKLH